MLKDDTSKHNKLFSPYTINILFVMLSMVGLALLPRLTVKLNPQERSQSLSVSFQYPGAAAQIIEHQVTSVLEGALSTLNGVKLIESVSSIGSGYINIETEKNTRIETLRFQVLSIIKDLWQNMPEEVSYPEISNSKAGTSEQQLLFSYTLNGDASSPELFEYANYQIRNAINEIQGISDIEVFGSTPFEWHFIYNRQQLRQYGISPYEITNALYSWQQPTSLGVGMSSSDGEAGSYPIILSYKDSKNLDANWKKIPVKNINGHIIYLGNIAERRIVQQQPSAYFRINGLNTVSVNVFAEETSNQISLANQVYKAEEKMKQNLPSGWSLIRMYDSSEFLRKEISTTSIRLGIALLLLLVLVMLVHRSWRYLLLITLSLIANLALAVVLFYMFKVEIHLVSIAGITVSIGIIIDNFIMMADYLKYRKNIRIFTALLGATLTSLGALVVVFFLDETDRTNLIDFTWVVIINLSVSLAVALLLIPSLMKALRIESKMSKKKSWRLKLISRMNGIYAWYIRIFNHKRRRWIIPVVFLLIFGLPVNLLPVQLKDKSIAAGIYNKTLGSNFFNSNIKPVLTKYTGGTLVPFMNHISGNSILMQQAGETILYIYVSLPGGSTIEQLNDVCIKLESYLKQFNGIRQFQTFIYGPQSGRIHVYFTKESQETDLPYQVKNLMIEKANEFAGADFGIYMQNDGFSNELREGSRSNSIQLSGFNYRELLNLALIAGDSLSQNPRIKNMTVFSGSTQFDPTIINEKSLLIDKQKLSALNIDYLSFIEEMQMHSAAPVSKGVIKNQGVYTQVKVFEKDWNNNDLWYILHNRMDLGQGGVEPSSIGSLQTIKVDGSIHKKDQSYLVLLAFDYVGPYELAQRVIKREIENLNQKLPLGYKAELPKYDYSWMFGEKPARFWLLGLIILIIWGLCAMIFESLIQPFVVISIIPVSFAGTFFTFTYFDITFDEGGYAALIMLSGLVVNTIIYILNDINHFRRNTAFKPIPVYLKAFNIKIIPILLTSISTILGLLPFLLVDGKAPFWTAFAAGTIGGLIFAIPATILLLPMLIRMKQSPPLSISTNKELNQQEQ